MMRPLIAGVLSVLLVVTAPGLEAYHAAAAVVAANGRQGRSAGPAASRTAAPILDLAAPLGSPSLSAVGAAPPAAAARAADGVRPAAVLPASAPAQTAAAVSSVEGVEVSQEAERVAKRPAVKRLLDEAVARFARPAALAVGLAVGAAAVPNAAVSQAMPPPTLAKFQKADADYDYQGGLAETRPGAPVVQAPLKAEASVEAKTVEIGGEVVVTLKVTNAGKTPADLGALAEGLKKAAPGSIAVRSVSIPGGALEPGKTAEVAVRVQLLQVNEVPAGGEGPVKIEAFKVETPGLTLTFPEIRISGRAVLPEDWKDGSFNPPKQPLLQRAWDSSYLIGLLLLPLGWILGRRLSARRAGSDGRLDGPKPAAEKALSSLSRAESAADARSFYAAVSRALTAYLPERLGLPLDEGRAHRRLLEDVRAAGGLTEAELERLAGVLGRADSALFGGADVSAQEREADLAFARSLVRSAPAAAAGSRRADGASMELAHPSMLLAFLIFVPILGKMIVDALRKDRTVPVSSLEGVPQGKTAAQRLRWVPNALIAAAMAAAILAAAQPREGSLLTKMVVPVTKILSLSDNSGSMGGQMDGGDGITKLEAVVAAERAFIRDQRKGASNQIGVAVWDTSVVIISPLTTDLRAAEAALAHIRLGGGTDADIAIRTGVNVFLKRNIIEIDEEKHPEARELKKVMWEKGLGPALELFLKEKPGSPLWNLVVRPDQAKVIRLLTDGDSSGDPVRAAQIAKHFGVKIHTIGIPASDLKADLLRAIAETTGGRFALATDAAALADIQLAISREVKTPVAVHVPASKEYQDELNMLAFLLAAAGVALRYARAKAVAVLAALTAAFLALAPARANAQAPQAPAVTPRYEALKPYATIPELQRGRALVDRARALEAQGKQGEADVLYREAVMTFLQVMGRHPELPEIRFDIGTAFLGLKDIERAEQFLRKALDMALKNGDKRMQGQALYQLAASALMDEDAEGADLLLRQALQADPEDMELKENAERLQRMVDEQQKEQKDKKKDQKKGKGKPQAKKQKSGEQKQRADQRRDGQKQPGQQKDKGEPGQEPTPGEGSEKGKPNQDEIAKQLQEAQKGQEKSGTPPGGFGKMWGMAPFAALGAGAGLSPDDAFAAAAGAADTALAWSQPGWLLAAALILPVLAGLAAYRIWSDHRKARAQAPLMTAPEAGASSMARREFLKSAAAVTGVGLLGAAAAGPWSGLKEIPVNFGGGRDIIVGLDLSNSVVFAEDGRFLRALTSVDALVRGMETSNKLDRVGLLPFAEEAGEAALTTDYVAVRERLLDMRGENLRFKGGSVIANMIVRSIEVFEAAEEIGARERVIILLSDGGDVMPREISEAEAERDADKAESRDLNEALKLARSKGIRIYTVGIGSTTGARMAIPPEIRAKDDKLPPFIQDAAGQDVVVRLNQPALDAIARATGGEPLVAESGKGLGEALKKISVLERRRSGAAVETVKVKDPLASWLSLPGAALLGLALWLQRKPPVENAPTKLHSFAAPAALMAFDWSKLLPDTYGLGMLFSALITLGLGIWLVDVMFGNRPLRRLGMKIDDWAGLMPRGVRRDGAALLIGAEGRELDARRLDEFVGSWIAAGRTLRPSTAAENKEAILKGIDPKDDLWREKLVAAYLAEGSAQVRAQIRATMSRLDLGSLAPLSETLDGLLARRGARRWLTSDLASGRLAGLFRREDLARPAPRAFFEQLADSPDPALRAEVLKMLERDAVPAKTTWGQKLRRLPALAGIAALLGGALVFDGLAVKNVQVAEAKRQAVLEQVSREFFGGDAYILTQPYADARIAEDVLPVLARWNSLRPQDKARIDKAIGVLASSTDSKAENVMTFMFRQRVIFMLDKDQQKALIRALAERNSAELLTALVQDMAKKPSPIAKERFDYAVSVLSELKGRNNYFMLVQLLREENPAVSQPAYEALAKALSSAQHQPQALGWLKLSLERLGNDPAVRLRHAQLVLETMASRAEPSAHDVEEAQRLLLQAATLADKTGSPDEIELSLGYKTAVLEAIGDVAARRPQLKSRTALREMVWATLSKATAQTLAIGSSVGATGSEFGKLVGQHGLRTITVDPDILVKDGKVRIPPGVQIGLIEDFLTRYHQAGLERAAALIAEQAAGRAGSDQLKWPADKGPAYLEGAAAVLQQALELAKALGVEKDSPADQALAAFIGGLAAQYAGDELNGPFQKQTWREYITGTDNTSVPFPTLYALADLPGLLSRLEKIQADGRLDVKTRSPKELADNEKKALANAIVKLRRLITAPPEQIVLDKLIANTHGQIASTFWGQSWKEFVTGDTSGDFARGATAAELAALIARAEQVLAAGELRVPSRLNLNYGVSPKLNEAEKEKLAAGIAKLKILLEAKREQEAKASSRGGATLRSPEFVGLFSGALAMKLGGVEPLVFTMVMLGLALAAAIAFFRLGFHRRPKAAAEPAPSAEPLEHRLNQLELPAKAVADSLMTGLLRSRATGRDGFDQVDVAPREPGQDGGGRIDPIATARTGAVHYRLFEQDRDMPVMLFVDMSPSAQLGSQATTKRRVIEDAAGVIALAASQDRSVGLVLYTDRVEKIIEPRSGRDAALDLFNELVDFRPAGRGGDLGAALQAYALGGDNPRSLLVPVSDFLTGGYAQVMAAASAEGHVVMPVVVEDKLDVEAAGLGIQALRDVETGEVRVVDTSAGSVRRAQAAAAARSRAERDSAFQQAQALPIRLSTDGRHLDEIIRQSREIGDAHGQ